MARLPRAAPVSIASERPRRSQSFEVTVSSEPTGPDLDGRLIIGCVDDRSAQSASGQSCPVHGDRAAKTQAWTTIHHNERGVVYNAGSYIELLCGHDMIRNKSGKDNCCYDNAMAESFFGSLKNELQHRNYHTREQARMEIFE